MPVASGRSLLLDFALVIFPGEVQNCGCLPESGEGVDRDGALGFVAVLGVAVDDVPEVLVEIRKLRGFDRPEVCVPFATFPVVLVEGVLGQRLKLTAGHLFRLQAGGCVNEPLPTFLAGQGEIVHPGFGYRLCCLLFRGHQASSSASA